MKLEKKKLIGALIALVALVLAYFGFKGAYTDKFYMKTTINQVDVSHQTLQEAKENVEKSLKNETVILKSGKQTIAQYSLLKDFQLTYDIDQSIKDIKKETEGQFIGTLLFSQKDYHVSMKGQVKAIEKKIQSLNVLKGGKNNPTKNAYLKYNSKTKKMEVVKEHYGQNYHVQQVASQLYEDINNGQREINLANKKYYVQPTVLSTQKELNDKKEALNKVLGAEITLAALGNKVVINPDVYGEWFTLNNNKAELSEEKLRKYVETTLSQSFDTLGKDFSFTGADGQVVKVLKGTYGSKLLIEKEVAQLKEEVLNKKVVTRKPHIEMNGNDTLGKDYVVVNIEKQNLKAYKAGKCIVDTPIVTGALWGGRATTKGAYFIFYKQAPAVLRGYKNGELQYESPVNFWMPFHRGQGLHNAPWRGAFGGTIYKRSGSHGCVNMTYRAAQTVYKNFEKGTPVIVI